MKKLIYYLVFVLIFVLLPFRIINAAEVRSETDRSIIIEENIENDFYVTGEENIVIKGNIKGDLFIAAGKVDIQGTVGGDLYAAGGDINVNNSISGNAFVAGGNIRVNKSIEKSIFVAGGNITIEGEVGEDMLVTGGQISINGKVKDDVRMAGGNITIDGEIGDDLMLSAGTASLNGNVGGDVYAAGEEMSITAEEIGGDLIYYGNESNLTLSDDLNIQGNKQINDVSATKDNFDFNFDAEQFGAFFILGVIWKLIQIVGLILVGYLIVKFAPLKTEGVLNNLNGITEQLKSLGIGCLAFPIGIVLLLLLIVTLFGIPLARLFFALALLVFAIITPLAGLALGRAITNLFGQKYNHLLALFLGIVILQLLKIIPILGNIISFITFFLLIGAVLRFLYQKQILARSYINRYKHSDAMGVDNYENPFTTNTQINTETTTEKSVLKNKSSKKKN